MTVRIATRRSALAMWQARHVSGLLTAREPGLEVQLLELMTRGDRILDVPLAEVGGKGLFVKEIEDALLRGDAQIAVHSMKDLPAVEPPGLVIAAVPVREDPRDALVSHGKKLSELPHGARVGTASLRRSAQLQALRPDLQIETIRGNVATRLRKIDEGFDAVVLAYAGLRRLGLADKVTQVFSTEEMLPAVAQGALAIEARQDDAGDAAAPRPARGSHHPDPDRGGARVPPQAPGRLPGAHRRPRRGEGRPRPPAGPGGQPRRDGDHPGRALRARRPTPPGSARSSRTSFSPGARGRSSPPSRRGRGSAAPRR